MIRANRTTRRRFRLSLVHPTILVYAGLTVFFVVVAQAASGLQSDLTAITGQGVGHVSVSPTARDRGEIFHAQVTVNVHDALPNTTFTVTRFVDQPNLLTLPRFVALMYSSVISSCLASRRANRLAEKVRASRSNPDMPRMYAGAGDG